MYVHTRIHTRTSGWRVNALGSGLIFVPVLLPSSVSSVVEHLFGKQCLRGSAPQRGVFQLTLHWVICIKYIHSRRTWLRIPLGVLTFHQVITMGSLYINIYLLSDIFLLFCTVC